MFPILLFAASVDNGSPPFVCICVCATNAVVVILVTPLLVTVVVGQTQHAPKLQGQLWSVGFGEELNKEHNGGRQCFLPAEVAGQGVRIARYCLAEINLGNPGSCSRKLSVEVVCGSLSRDSFQLLTIH